MSYLDRLKAINSEKCTPCELPKVPKPTYVSFGSTHGAHIQEGGPRSDDTATAWRWLLHYPDRDPVEVALSPPATHADVLAQYPEALAAEPIAETTAAEVFDFNPPSDPANDVEALEERAGVIAEGCLVMSGRLTLWNMGCH